MVSNRKKKLNDSLSYFILFIILSAIIIASGIVYYRNHSQYFVEKANRELSTVAELKVSELVQYRKERLADAAVLLRNESFCNLIKQALHDSNNKTANSQLKIWFKRLKSAYFYDDIYIIDSKQIPRFSVIGRTTPISSTTLKSVELIKKKKEIVFQDFYKNEYNNKIYLSILVPIFSDVNGKDVMATLVMRINPEKYLYPFIKRWPTASKTAETLLVRKDGNNVIYLNELRFDKKAAMNLRFSLDNINLPAAQVVKGRTGIMEGNDYLNNSVIASMKPIPNSPWFIVAKISTAEIYAPLEVHLRMVILLILILLICSASGLAFIYWQQHSSHFKELYELEAAQLLIENRFRETLEQKVIERTKQLQTSNTELESFAYSISHDLRTPLRAIDGFSRIIVDEYGDKLDEEGKRLLDKICSNINKLDVLITDLLTISRASRVDMNYTEIEMTEMVSSILYEATNNEGIGNFDIKIETLPKAIGDPILIKQVWLNLISNSIKYTMPNTERKIRISGLIKDGMANYTIKDNGVGFNPEYAHKLFGLFQRLHNGEDFEGTGVGLAIIQRIVNRHGGKVWAVGEVDKGAEFGFSLPIKKIV